MKMISVDPGTVTCGVAYWELDDLLNIEKLQTYTIYIDDKIPVEIRVFKLYDIFKNIFTELEPYMLAHEAGFINRFRPQAFGPIYTTILNIRKAFMDTISRTQLFSYPPKTVKAMLGSGDANKDDMFNNVNRVKELNRFLTDKQSEHEIDAIAIGYTHLLNLRSMPEILFI